MKDSSKRHRRDDQGQLDVINDGSESLDSQTRSRDHQRTIGTNGHDDEGAPQRIAELLADGARRERRVANLVSCHQQLPSSLVAAEPLATRWLGPRIENTP